MARNDVVRVSASNTTKAEKERRKKIADEERERKRPRLERANPNAVSVAETKAQLRALREDESTPEQVALRGYAQAIRDGRVVEGGLGAAATVAPMVAGMFTGKGSKRNPLIRVRTTGLNEGLQDIRTKGRSPGASSSVRRPGQGSDATRFDHDIVQVLPAPVAGDVIYDSDGGTALSSDFVTKRPSTVTIPKYLSEIAPRTGPVIKVDPVDLRNIKAGGDYGVSGPGLRLLDGVLYPQVTGRPSTLLSNYERELRGKSYSRIPTKEEKAAAYVKARRVVDNGVKFMEALRTGKTSTGSYELVPQERMAAIKNSDMRRATRVGLDMQELIDSIPERFRIQDPDTPGLHGHEVKSYDRGPLPERVIIRRDGRDASKIAEIKQFYESIGVKVDTVDNVEDTVRIVTDTAPRMASKGGNAPGESKSSGVPGGHNPALDGYQGPRIVINPSTFSNKKDALCVAWNEALRVAMEAMDYQPTSEPTEAQRRFFADTPYADDELQLRRTILARICVFDTSIS